MKILKGDFSRQGFMLVETDIGRKLIPRLKEKFLKLYLPRFKNDPGRNRNIIKLFAEDLEVKPFFCSLDITDILTNSLEMAEPVQTGPIVTHYTADDLTGNNYGLPYHQDWPSMGTSTKGVIAWTSITDLGRDDPGLRIIPGSHLAGLWPGEQTDMGYVLHQQEIADALDIEVGAGQILLMSPYLVHKTRTASTGRGWKLSLSCRFDDLACSEWSRRNYISAYHTVVDRSAYTK